MRPRRRSQIAVGEPPFTITGASGSHVVDRDGARYLDLTSGWNVVNAGWNNPELRDTWLSAMGELPFRPAWCDEAHLDQLKDMWAQILPGYSVVTSCTGGEAVDNALKLARLATGLGGVIGMAGAYHGSNSGAALAAGGQVAHLDPLGLASRTVTLPLPTAPGALGDAIRLIDSAEDAGAIIFEPVLSNMGCVSLPDDYLATVLQSARGFGLVTICDEVGTGIHRTGPLLSSIGRGIAPDIIVLGKALTNGLYPLSLCLIADRLVPLVDEPSFASTFGGAPAGCAAAIATLNLHRRDALGDRTKTSGALLRERLTRDCAALPGVTAIHGEGLELAVHIDWRHYDGRLTPYRLLEALRAKELFATLSPGEQHLMLMPPLTTPVEELLHAADRIAEALDG